MIVVTALFTHILQLYHSDMHSILESHTEVLKWMCILKGFEFFWELDKQIH